MVLTKEDKEWLVNSVTEKITSEIRNMGKRVERLETAYSMLARAARTREAAYAREQHDPLVREMFDASDLLLVPPIADGNSRERALGWRLTRRWQRWRSTRRKS
jgi:hypothetical protein